RKIQPPTAAGSRSSPTTTPTPLRPPVTWRSSTRRLRPNPTHPGLYHHVWLPDEELTEMSGLSQPTVSHRLKRLTEAGLLDKVRVGRTVTHQVRPELFEELRTVLQMDCPTTDEKETITHVTSKDFEAIIIGGGQAGLATAYYLLRAGVDTLVLDDQEDAG